MRGEFGPETRLFIAHSPFKNTVLASSSQPSLSRLDLPVGARQPADQFLSVSLPGMAAEFDVDYAPREANENPSNTLAGQYRAYQELLGSRRFWAYCPCMAALGENGQDSRWPMASAPNPPTFRQCQPFDNNVRQ